MPSHRILFYFLILLLPVQLGRHFWPEFSFVNGVRIDYLAPTVYLTDLIVLGMLIMWIRNNIKNQKSKIKNFLKLKNLKFIWSFAFLFLIFNVIFSSVSHLALIKSLKLLELLFLILYIKNNSTMKQFNNVLVLLLFTVYYSSIIAWIQFINQSSIGGVFWFLGERTFNPSTPGIALADIGGKLILRPYAVFPHPNVLAGFLTVLLPFVLFLQRLTKPNRFIKIINFPILLLMLLTIFITFSRTAWIVSMLIIFSAILITVKKRRKIIILLFAFCFFNSCFFLPLPVALGNRSAIFFSSPEISWLGNLHD